MAASTPRKAPAKKAPAKKAAPRRTVEERTDENIARFDEYRDRARRMKLGKARATIEPYIVSSAELEDGIDADLVLAPPRALSAKLAFDRAVRNQDLVGAIVTLGGEGALNRVVRAFETHAERTGDDAEELFVGFVYSVINHINGHGAADVPGGSGAS